MEEFTSSVQRIALNFEKENVCIVVFGSDTTIKGGDLVKHTGSIVDVPAVDDLQELCLILVHGLTFMKNLQ